MSKSTFAVIAMAIAMIALLAFGGTYAYFTAVSNEFTSQEGLKTATIKLGTTGSATLTITEEDYIFLLPGDAVSMTATVQNESDEKIWAFCTFKLTNAPEGSLELAPGDDWTLVDGTTNVYSSPIAEGGEISLVATGKFAETVKGEENMGVTINVTAKFAAAQQRHLTVAQAYQEVKTLLA